MTSPAPDMSGLTIGGEGDYDFNDLHTQQQHKTFHYAQSPANNPLSTQFQFAPASLGQQATKKPARAALPSQWLDGTQETTAPAPVTPDANINRALSPPHTSDFSSSGGSPPPPSVPQIQPPQLYGIAQQQGFPQAPASHHSDDDIIPNAIVIKNIPFTVKRETLLDIIASLNIPTPYAFNYHIDTNGQFRGLAFANFRVATDADAVVAALNGFDVQGRKLRVEYKKVLLAGEKERIEREKAMRRMRSMQLEKERERTGEWDAFPSVAPSSGGDMSPLGGGGGGYSLTPGMPSPSPNRFSPQVGMGMFSPSMPQPYPSPPPPIAASMKAMAAQNELDLNDPATLEIYSRILVFKEDRMRDELAFSRTLTPRQRRIVHLAAQRLGVYHYSVGEGEERYAVVTRIPRDGDAAPPRQPVRHASQTFLRSSSNTYNSQSPQTPSGRGSLAAPGAEGIGFFKKQSMPNLKSAYATESGGRSLQNRPSNSNLSAYKTLTGYEPRRNKEFGALFGGSDIPPVPTLPTIPSMEGGTGVVRQPRGPGNGGFARRPTAEGRPTATSPGLDARTHEPLEI